MRSCDGVMVRCGVRYGSLAPGLLPGVILESAGRVPVTAFHTRSTPYGTPELAQSPVTKASRASRADARAASASGRVFAHLDLCAARALLSCHVDVSAELLRGTL